MQVMKLMKIDYILNMIFMLVGNEEVFKEQVVRFVIVIEFVGNLSVLFLDGFISGFDSYVLCYIIECFKVFFFVFFYLYFDVGLF